MPSGDISSETRNLTPLLVFRNGDPTITDLEPGSDKIDPNHQNIQDKIIAALKLLSFWEPRVLVQFWSPHVAGKHQWLTTSDQPIGLGVIDAGLCSYRQDSVLRCFVVEEEHEEEDRGPAARVFRRRLPEWTLDLDNYTPKQFPQQESAIRCNLHGYLALPVFDSNTQLCVGVLELLMSSKYKSYAYEIQKIHGALKTQNLTSPQGLDISALYTENPVTPQGLDFPALNTENRKTPQGLDYPALNDNYFGNRYSNDTWGSNAANEEEEVVSGFPVDQETQLPDLNKTPTPPVDEPNYPVHQVCPDYGYGYESPYVQQSGYGAENAPVDEPYYPSQPSYPGYGVYGDEGGYGSYSGYGGDGGYGGEGGYSGYEGYGGYDRYGGDGGYNVYDRSKDEVGYGGYGEHGGYGYESRNTSLYEPSTPSNPFQVNEIENPMTPQEHIFPALNTGNPITPQGINVPALNTEAPISPQEFDFPDLYIETLISQLEFDFPDLYTENRITPQGLDYPALNTLITSQGLDFLALNTETPISQQEFDFPDLYVPKESRQRDFEKIISTLKLMCDIHSLPLAQTWAVSKHSSFVSHEKVIQKSCSSFDTRCVGKVCMSAADLPFHVKDPHMLTFKEACRMKHLDKSHGFVGKALSCRGSCFCGDVTKLCEEEYPLVQNARMHRLTSCFAVFLNSVEANDEYVLEFFLPPDIKDSGHVQNLVQTLKQNIEITSGFELGDTSCIQVVEPPIVVSKSSGIDPHTIQIASITTTNFNRVQAVTSDSESIMVYTDGKQSCPWDHFTLHDSNVAGPRKNNEIISCLNVIQKMSDNITDAGERNNHVKQDRKRKIGSLTMDAVVKHVGKPMEQASKILGVSRSTLRRFCRENGVSSWPLPEHRKKTVHITELKPSQKAWTKQNLQRRLSSVFSHLAFAVFLVIKIKRWSCSIKCHGFSGKWWSCGRHSYLPSKSACICKAVRLILQLRRWRYKKSMSSLRSSDLPALSESTTKPRYTSTPSVVTVKATFNDDIIKFKFHRFSGLSELEQEVARRIKVNNSRLLLTYQDEDGDQIILVDDDDLRTLLRFADDRVTIKFIIRQ